MASICVTFYIHTVNNKYVSMLGWNGMTFNIGCTRDPNFFI